MSKKHCFLGLFMLLGLLPAMATSDSTLRYANAIYESDIRAVRLYQKSSGFPFPILTLGVGESLVLEFDQIRSERDFYQYTLIHCDAHWNPSALSRTQTLDGMGYDNVENANFSNGTLMQYTHYATEVPGSKPSQNCRVTICCWCTGISMRRISCYRDA